MAQGDGDQAQPATRHTLQDPPLVPQCGTVLAGLVFSGEGLQVCGGPEKAQQACPLSHGSGPCQPRHIRRMGSPPCPPALCTSWQLAAGGAIGTPRFFPVPASSEPELILCPPQRRAWVPTPALLPGGSHGQRSLAGHSP